MVLTGVALLPHGTMLLDPERDGLPDGAVHISERTADMARQIVELAPGLVVLTTPHGLSLDQDIAVYMNSVAMGTGEWNGQWKNFELEVPLSTAHAEQLRDALRADGVKVQGLLAHSGMDCPLRWAEVVPLWFLIKRGGYTGKLVILGMPLKGSASTSNLQLAGDRIAKYCQRGMWQEERVFLAVSGDLSHVHASSFPDPLFLPDPRSNLPENSLDAQLFDALIQDWALDMGRGRSLAAKCLQLEKTAKACALTGLLLAEGAMAYEDKHKRPLLGQVFAIGHPTYFTMATVLFEPACPKYTSSAGQGVGEGREKAGLLPDLLDRLKAQRIDVQRNIETLLQAKMMSAAAPPSQT